MPADGWSHGWNVFPQLFLGICVILLLTGLTAVSYTHLDVYKRQRHTYTSNLLANGAAPKDVQELLGHSDVSTKMNVYAHSTCLLYTSQQLL